MSLPRLFLLLGLLLAQPLLADNASRYHLASGDVIRINVFGEPDLSFAEIRLNDTGTFSYPFLGQVQARGKTAGEVERLITEQLRDGYLVDPKVTLSVITYREFFISGEVQKPGGYPYQPGLTLDRAIALAGGMTERASANRVTITRSSGESRQIEKANLDTAILPGDTITIDQGFF